MTKNIAAAAKALSAELDAGHQEQADLNAYMAELDELVGQIRGIKGLYKRELAVEATRRARIKKAAEIAAMKARLEELENAAK